MGIGPGGVGGGGGGGGGGGRWDGPGNWTGTVGATATSVARAGPAADPETIEEGDRWGNHGGDDPLGGMGGGGRWGTDRLPTIAPPCCRARVTRGATRVQPARQVPAGDLPRAPGTWLRRGRGRGMGTGPGGPGGGAGGWRRSPRWLWTRRRRSHGPRRRRRHGARRSVGVLLRQLQQTSAEPFRGCLRGGWRRPTGGDHSPRTRQVQVFGTGPGDVFEAAGTRRWRPAASVAAHCRPRLGAASLRQTRRRDVRAHGGGISRGDWRRRKRTRTEGRRDVVGQRGRRGARRRSSRRQRSRVGSRDVSATGGGGGPPNAGGYLVRRLKLTAVEAAPNLWLDQKMTDRLNTARYNEGAAAAPATVIVNPRFWAHSKTRVRTPTRSMTTSTSAASGACPVACSVEARSWAAANPTQQQQQQQSGSPPPTGPITDAPVLPDPSGTSQGPFQRGELLEARQRILQSSSAPRRRATDDAIRASGEMLDVAGATQVPGLPRRCNSNSNNNSNRGSSNRSGEREGRMGAKATTTTTTRDAAAGGRHGNGQPAESVWRPAAATARWSRRLAG